MAALSPLEGRHGVHCGRFPRDSCSLRRQVARQRHARVRDRCGSRRSAADNCVLGPDSGVRTPSEDQAEGTPAVLFCVGLELAYVHVDAHQRQVR